MQHPNTFIQNALDVLLENNFLYSIEQVQQFFDEPQVFQYSSSLNTEKIKNLTNYSYDIHGLGCSFSSKEIAIAKCLGESIERLCNYLFSKKKITYGNSRLIQDVLSYYPRKIKHLEKMGVVQGMNAITNSKAYIPAQLIYVSYGPYHKEEQITEHNTTGAAGGFTHEAVLLSGIYELIERDAFMTMYLGQLRPVRVAVDKLPSPKIQHIVQICKRYNLQLNLFDITNDLTIPAFVTFLIDPTGIGPALTLGLRAGMRIEETIIGSLEEAFVTRYSLRKHILHNNEETFEHSPEIQNIFARGTIWSSLSMLKHIDFLLNQKEREIPLNSFPYSPEEELALVINTFRQKHVPVFYADISQDVFKKINYLTYKVVTPALQPLYLFEENKEIRLDRVKAAARYYHQDYKINTIPHPVL